MVVTSLRGLFRDFFSLDRNVKALIVVSVMGNWIIAGYMFNLFLRFLGADDSQIGFIFSIGAVTSVFASFAGGCLADRFNRKYLYTFGVYGIAIMYLFYPLINSWQLVIPIYVANMIFTFIMASAWRPLMADSVSSNKRGFTFGVLSTVTAINWTIGNAVGGYVAEAYGFNIMWYLICFALTVQATLSLIFLRETNRGTADERKLDLSSKFNLFDAKNRSLIFVYVILLIFSLQSGLVGPFLPIYLENLGFSESIVGLVGSLSFLALGTTLLFLGRISDRIGRRLPISCFLAIGAIFIFLLPFVKNDALIFMLASLANLGLSTWYLSSAIQPLVADLSKAEWRGRAMSIMFTVMGVGGIIGPSIGGFMWENMPIHIPFICSSLINVALAISLMKIVPEPKKLHAEFNRQIK